MECQKMTVPPSQRRIEAHSSRDPYRFNSQGIYNVTRNHTGDIPSLAESNGLIRGRAKRADDGDTVFHVLNRANACATIFQTPDGRPKLTKEGSHGS